MSNRDNNFIDELLGNNAERDRQRRRIHNARIREKGLIREAGRTPKNRRGRPPTTRNNRVLIRDNTDVINELSEISRPGSSDRYIGRQTFDNTVLAPSVIGSVQDSSTQIDYEELQKRLEFNNRFFKNGRGTTGSGILSSITDDLYAVDLKAQETTDAVSKTTTIANDSLNSTLLLASGVVSALGSSLDTANAVLLNAVFLSIQTVRAIAVSTSKLSFGITAITGGLSVLSLIAQSYKIRQNQQTTANDLGQTASSLQALQVIGGSF